MAISVSDKTVNPLIVVSGGTITPFSAVTVNDDAIGVTSDVLVEFADPTVTLTNIGTLVDPNGGGTTTFPGPGTIGVFEEKATNTGVPTAGTSILDRLQYTAPKLANGQFQQTIDAFFDQETAQTTTESPPTTPLIDVVTPPAVSGTVANQPVAALGTIKPFATAAITDGDFGGAKDVASITITDGGTPTDNDGILVGAGLSKTGVGTYTLPNPTDPATLVTELQNLSFNAPNVFGTHNISMELDVQDVPPAGGTPPPGVDLTKALTTKDTTTSLSVVGGAAPPNNFMVVDTTTNMTTQVAGDPYTGPVAGLTNDIIDITPDNLDITAGIPNVFIRSGSGNDALDVSGVNGNNILDASTGTNFLVGGTGNDTFFIDDRNATADIFSTIKGFHSGDQATVFGITQSGATIKTGDNVLPSAPGLDFAITAPGKPNANFNIPGYSTADLSNGKLTTSFGTTPDTPGLPGSPYMLITAT